MQVGAHSVQHLKFEIVLGYLLRRCVANGRRDHPRVVRGDAVIEATGQQELHQPDEIGIHIGFLRKGNFL